MVENIYINDNDTERKDRFIELFIKYINFMEQAEQ